MSKKSRSDDDFDEFLVSAPRQSSTSQLGTYFVLAFAVTLLPLFVFHAIYEFKVQEYWYIFAPVNVGTAILLTLAYRNVAYTARAKISRSRQGKTSAKRLGVSASTHNAQNEELADRESFYWSLFFNNAIFFGLFLFLAFYALRNLSIFYNYPLALLVASALQWQLSTTA